MYSVCVIIYANKDYYYYYYYSILSGKCIIHQYLMRGHIFLDLVQLKYENEIQYVLNHDTYDIWCMLPHSIDSTIF